MKTCQQCGFATASLEEQREPPGAPEDCPQCGGLGTVTEDGRSSAGDAWGDREE